MNAKRRPHRTMNGQGPTPRHYSTTIRALAQCVGVFLFLVGGAAVESPNPLFSIAGIAVGAALIFITEEI